MQKMCADAKVSLKLEIQKIGEKEEVKTNLSC